MADARAGRPSAQRPLGQSQLNRDLEAQTSVPRLGVMQRVADAVGVSSRTLGVAAGTTVAFGGFVGTGAAQLAKHAKG